MSKNKTAVNRISEAKEKIVAAADAGVDKIKDLGSNLDANVQSKPYHFIACAAIIGLVLGILISRDN